MKFFIAVQQLIALLPDDVVQTLKHGAAVGCGIIVFGTVADIAKWYLHDPLIVQIIETTDHVVLVAFVVGLGIEFVVILYKRIMNSIFHSWVLLA